MFQGIQAREGLLGHGFDLVSKQSPAVSKHEGCQYMKKGGEEEGGGNILGKGDEKREQNRERSTISRFESDKIDGGGGIGNLNCVEISQEEG